MSNIPRIKINGIRHQAPSGYMLGRVDQGGGDVQLVSLRDLAQRLVKTGVVQSGYTTTLKGLKDVNLGTLSDKQVLTYVLADDKWENVTLTLAGGYLSDVLISAPSDGQIPIFDAASAKWKNEGIPIFIQKDCIDETTALTVATVKTFRTPSALTLTDVRASLTTAQATDGAGGIFTVDVKQNGTSILSTLLTIDNTETTSTSAATPAVLAKDLLDDDDEMNIDVTQVGDGTAAGLKVTLIGTLGTGTISGTTPPDSSGGSTDFGGVSDTPTVTLVAGGVTAGGTTTVHGKSKTGAVGKLLYDIGTPVAGATYILEYTPDFSQLALLGKLAMVGIGLKANNDFTIIGLRGDGSTGIDGYKVYGATATHNGWNKLTGQTTDDAGAAAHGTQAGPNYIKLAIADDGTTVTVSTSTDNVTYGAIYTTITPSPFTNTSQVLEFGPAAWIDGDDAGEFSVQFNLWIVTSSTSDDELLLLLT